MSEFTACFATENREEVHILLLSLLLILCAKFTVNVPHRTIGRLLSTCQPFVVQFKLVKLLLFAADTACPTNAIVKPLVSGPLIIFHILTEIKRLLMGGPVPLMSSLAGYCVICAVRKFPPVHKSQITKTLCSPGWSLLEVDVSIFSATHECEKKTPPKYTATLAIWWISPYSLLKYIIIFWKLTANPSEVS